MNPQRRSRLLGAGAAIVAGAAGVGWALWRHDAATPAPETALWRMRFDTPNGSPLEMAGLLGQFVVVNFWATWCAPCIREMPALDRFQRDFAARGWRVVGLAIDQAAPVREFLARTPVTFEVGLAASGGIELSRRLGNLAGGLPFTVLFGRDGAILQRRIGETQYDQLVSWAHSAGQ